MSRKLLKVALGVMTQFCPENDSVRAIKLDIETELAKPDSEILCSSCKAIGAAYAIGKECQQQKLLNTNQSEWIDKAKKLAGEYAHCYAFVGDDTMPKKHEELMNHLNNLPQQKPLSVDEILKVLNDINEVEDLNFWERSAIFRGMRLAEKAHGIGVDK